MANAVAGINIAKSSTNTKVALDDGMMDLVVGGCIWDNFWNSYKKLILASSFKNISLLLNAYMFAFSPCGHDSDNTSGDVYVAYDAAHHTY